MGEINGSVLVRGEEGAKTTDGDLSVANNSSGGFEM